MNVYSVILNKPSKDTWKALEEKWPAPHHYVIDDHLAFIASGQEMLVSEISNALGMNNEDQVFGVVLKVRSGEFYGFNEKGLWAWIDQELT